MITIQKKKAGSAAAYMNVAQIKQVRKMMKPDGIIVKLAQTFKVLGDPTRVKIIFALSQKELCVHDIAQLMNMSQSAISHQLSILRHMELVKFRRDGQNTFYSLDDEHISNLFDEGIRHVED